MSLRRTALRLIALSCVLTLAATLVACGGGSGGSGGADGATGNKWNALKWGQGKWGP